MSKRTDSELLHDIQESIQRIIDYTKNIDYAKFIRDIKTQDAVVRNLEIMGEAVKNISKPLIAQYPNVPWTDLAKVRDKLIHHYFGVNLDIVWNIIEDSLPDTTAQIKRILTDRNKNLHKLKQLDALRGKINLTTNVPTARKRTIEELKGCLSKEEYKKEKERINRQ